MFCRYPLGGISVETLSDNILGVGGDILPLLTVEGVVALFDLDQDLLVSVTVERWLATQDDVQDDTQ